MDRKIAVGIKKPNGDIPVTIVGGTGAYENVGGHGFKDGNNGRVNYTLNLILWQVPLHLTAASRAAPWGDRGMTSDAIRRDARHAR